MTENNPQIEILYPGVSSGELLTTYDGNKIVICNISNVDQICSEFEPGTYGFDCEYDYRNGSLRLLQVYDPRKKTTFLFSWTLIHPIRECSITRFLRSKDRVKVMVDSSGDIKSLGKHMAFMKHKYNYNGFSVLSYVGFNSFFDLQTLARIKNEGELSLNALASKYVADINGFLNVQKLGLYSNPSDEQYIYAANDAVLSYKIHMGLCNIEEQHCTAPTQQEVELL